MASKRGSFAKFLFVCLYLLLGAALLLAGLIVSYRFIAPSSTLMLAKIVTGQKMERRWRPLSEIAPIVTASVIASEDANFCYHHGVDWESLFSVMDTSKGPLPSRGASTIAMQTAKNLFLWPLRSVIRKAIEIPLALSLNVILGKPRVMEIYLNIAEWGEGIFGVETAAELYFHKNASELDAREAALLATSLPNPKLRNPAKPSPRQRALAVRIMNRAKSSELNLRCLR
jgi:monofunctional biosynthetic peptidoglycan transglycosylase